MGTKTPALSTQLKAAQAQIAELTKKVESLTKEKDGHYQRSIQFQEEIDQVHALLDALPGAAPRKTEDPDAWSARDIKTMTRLAAYLANRQQVA